MRRLRAPFANLLGVLVPAVLAIALTPLLIARLGPALFGLFSLQIAALVLLGVNDFGIARAVMLVAIARGGAERAGPRVQAVQRGLQLAAVLATALLLPAAIVVAAPLDAELTRSSLIVLLSAGLTVLALPLRASMAIDRRFVALNLVRGLASGLIFAAPAAAVLVEPTLTACALALLASRLAVLALYVAVARVPLGGRSFSGRSRGFVASVTRGRLPRAHRELVRRAGWMGVAGAASLAVGYIDRLAVGLLAGPVAAAHYAVAAEMASKLWLVIGALTSAETPRVAAEWDARAQAPRGDGLGFAITIMMLISAASLLTALLAGDALLRAWLGASFAPEMTAILHLLVLGVSLSALTQVNVMIVNVAGRERSMAMLQFVMLPATLLLTAAAVGLAGVRGAAAVFALRLFVDGLLVRHAAVRAGGPTVGVSTRAYLAWAAFLVALYAAGTSWSG